MTILEQAEQIRDATGQYSNTPARVGGCLVDIANDLTLLWEAIANIQQPSINSASFCFSSDINICNTPCPTTGTRLVLIDGSNTDQFKFATGTGPVVVNSGGTFYFSGLDPARAYQVSFSIAFYYDDTKQVSIGLRNAGEGLNGITGVLNDFIIIGSGSSNRIPLTITAGITGTTSCALVISGESETTFSLLACNAVIIDMGPIAE